MDYVYILDVLEKVLFSVCVYIYGKVWCVFGCGGDRDKGKCLLMVSVVEFGVDFLVIIMDNSWSEVVEDIVKDIMVGLSNFVIVILEFDREWVIRYCFDSVSFEDIVIVVGKGYEDY